MKWWLISALVLWMAFQSVVAAARPVMPCCATECHDVVACAAMACSAACSAAAALPAGPAITARALACDVSLTGGATQRAAAHINEIWKPPR